MKDVASGIYKANRYMLLVLIQVYVRVSHSKFLINFFCSPLLVHLCRCRSNCTDSLHSDGCLLKTYVSVKLWARLFRGILTIYLHLHYTTRYTYISTSVRKTASLVAAGCGTVYFIGGALQRSRSGNRVEKVWDSGKARETQIVYL